MEGRENMSMSGVTVVGSDAPSDYHVAPRTTTESAAQMVVISQTPATSTAAVAVTGGGAGGGAIMVVKKKRGRPRKYGPDGALSPKPISSAGPAPSPLIDFSVEKQRGKIRPVGLVSKPHMPKMDVENSGEWVSCSVGANFTPHIITVNTGEVNY
uniref:AT-hook motif nuclear-localized protein n=1 Tax=Nicotiana tabacum TaxID=4097 RepID=A0A1S4ATH0_TOBAC|nr:PREDICTED: AT-hook motif nuclear-localized protein 1-like [Nicotiana tabacum]